MKKRVKKSNSILQCMALRQPLDYVTIPATFFIAILSVYVIVDSMLVGIDHTMKEIRHFAPVVLFSAAPFVIAALIVVTKLDQSHSHLAALAMTDPLTGLPNRRSLTLQIDTLQVHDAVGFLLIIDADHFKRVNDTYGHGVGDECLLAIADRLRDIARPDDVYGRIGGEEFGAYLPYTTAAELRSIGEKLCKGVSMKIEGQDAPLRLTLSVGATETYATENITAALQRADEALYVAKNTGRARMVTWSKRMSDKAA